MTNQQSANQDLEQLAKEVKRQYAREYYQKKRKEILAQRKLHRRENREAMLEKEKAYRAANKDKVRKWNADYWIRRASGNQTSNEQ